jgi:hypothetical protein
MCEDLGYDFVRQPQDWVLVRIESLLYDGFLESQFSDICGASTICKRTEHDGLRVKLDSGRLARERNDYRRIVNSPIVIVWYAVLSLVQVLALKIERICARLDPRNEFLWLSGWSPAGRTDFLPAKVLAAT